MLQYLLTGLAGVMAGIVAMRVWTARQATSANAQPAAADAAGGAPAGAPSSPNSTRNLLIAAAVLAVAGLGVLLLAPADEAAAPGGSTAAASAVAAAPGGKALDDVDTMIGRLEARLKQNPDDGEGFRMLGWSHVMTGKPDKAIAPYKRALALQPQRAVVHSGYGEALVGIAGNNTVTPEAKAAFEKALSLDRTEPRARYFLALWQAQNGHEKVALDQLVALSNSGPADAPWQEDVRRQISVISGKLGIDVSARIKQPAPPSAAAAVSMPAGGQPPSVDSMVDGLAARLKANPADAEGWAMLLRSRMVLKQADRAGNDLAIARKALAGDAAGLARVNAAARDLGVPGA